MRDVRAWMHLKPVMSVEGAASKGCKLYNFIHLTFFKRQNYRDKEQINGFKDQGQGECLTAKKETSGNFDECWHCSARDGYKGYECIKM
jgi:hypothetical protein